jgi:hypothetical protein
VRAAGLSCTAVPKLTLWALDTQVGLSVCFIFIFPHRALLAVLGGCVLKKKTMAVGSEGAARIRICNEGQKSEAISALVACKFKLYDTSPGMFAMKVTCSRVMVAELP